MSEDFSRKTLRSVVAALCQTIGWQGTHSSPLEVLVDLMQQYLKDLGKRCRNYAEQFGHTSPNLDDIGLAFQDMGINLLELEEYIKNVDIVSCPVEVPKYPIPRESHLNFLKRGCREVVTRPVHVHEHLPPMHPEMEEEEYVGKQTVPSDASSPTSSSAGTSIFKKPGDPPSVEIPLIKRPRWIPEEEGRPLREISSVMMTTSGFLSPAREGKLPESRTPLQPSDSRSNSPQPSSYPMVPPEVKGEKKAKKAPYKKGSDGIKKLDKENKKKESRIMKELIRFDKSLFAADSKIRKVERSKLTALKTGAKKVAHSNASPGSSTNITNKLLKIVSGKIGAKSPGLSSVKGARQNIGMKPPKAEKSNPIIPLVPVVKICKSPERNENDVIEGKLSAEPDKQKLNIFKKISKVKEEKSEKLDKEKLDVFDQPCRDSRESSPGLVIDESELNSRQREVRMAQIDDCIDAVIQQSIGTIDVIDNPEDDFNRFEKEHKVMSSSTQAQDTLKLDTQKGESTIEQQPNADGENYMFGDYISPPVTPSTPKTPEIMLSRKSEKFSDQKEKKRKKDKSKSKREGKANKLRSPGTSKKIKLDIQEPVPLDRPKTPEASDCHNVNPSVFPFFSNFLPAPGLIPPPIGHPLFPRLPISLGKNLPHPAMPNLPLPPPHFMQPVPDIKDKSPDKLSTVSSNINSPDSTSKFDKSDRVVLSSPTLKDKTSEKKSKEHKKEKKDKEKTKKKKDRKDKGKNKDKSEKKKVKIEKKDKEKLKERKEKKEKKKDKGREDKTGENSVPKITFKLGPASPRPPTPEPQSRKIVIKTLLKKSFHEEGPENIEESASSELAAKREPSPELAKISALIIRPPKPKSSSKTILSKQDSSCDDALPSSSPPIKSTTISSICNSASSIPSDTASPSSCSGPTSSKIRKNAKAVPKVKSKDLGKNVELDVESQKEAVAYYYDNDGNKVWICPACGGQDDGSPMIGCDDCDAWYHWVCVGIQVPPDENEDWYCRVCIVKKQGNLSEKKKKNRKRKMTT